MNTTSIDESCTVRTPDHRRADPAVIGTDPLPDLAARVDACLSRLRYRVVELTVRAKRQLGLAVAAEEAELVALRETVPTYATSLRLTGAASLPLYDEWPWGPQFHSRGAFRIALPHLRVGQVNRWINAAFLKRARRCCLKRWGKRGYVDDRFTVLDEFGRAVLMGEMQRLDGHRPRARQHVHWIPAPALSAVDEMKLQAAHHADEASIERGWDNFSTGEHLDELAERLRHAASCAEYGRRVIP